MKNRLMTHPIVSGTLWLFDVILSWPVAIILTASAFSHLSNRYYFLGSVYSYDLVGPLTGQGLAAVAPFLMLTLALCLFADLWKDSALVVTLGVLSAFAFAQVTAWARGRTIECSSFGPSYGEETIGLWSLGLVCTLLGLTAACLGWRWRRGVLLRSSGQR
jgi:hypothetical protein